MSQYSDEVKNCQIAETLDIAKGLKNCKRNFAECRQYEDDAIYTTHLCSQSEEQHLLKVENLSKIKQALTNIKEKIAKALLARTTGLATNCEGMLVLILKGDF